MIIENLSHACRRNGAGRALRAVASIVLAAASIVAPAAAYGAVPEKAEQNITFSIPTSLRCAVRADGTVIAPSGWSMSNSGSGKVEITGVSVSNAIGKLKLSGRSGSVGYAVGDGSGSYSVSYDAAGGCRFSSSSNRPLGIESGKSLSWNWDIGKLNASDHRASIDAAVSGRARLCDMSFSYAPVGNSLSSAGTTGSMSGTVDSQSSSIVPVGGTATVNVGNVPSNASISYQWYTVDSNGSYSAIANANGKTLKVLAAYRGKDIVCRVSDSSGHYSGYVETARKPVRNLAPKVGISGSAVYGNKLTAAASGLPSGATYTYKYRWQRLSGSAWADIANATAAEYTLGGEDVGKQVRVIVSTASNIYTVDDVTAVSATVAKAKASINVSISGTKNNSSRLTASVNGLPTSGANTVSYRWQRSSDGKSNWVDSTAGDAKSNSIQMQPNDVSWHYRCIVSASNPYYDIASSISAAYGPIAKSTVSAAKATISGNAVYGGTIKANVTNVPTVGTNSISYQWQYSDDGKTWNDTRLDGGKNQSLVLSAVSCVGTQYRCVISVDNSYYIVPGCTTGGVKVGKASAQAIAKASGEAVAGKKLTVAVSGLPTVGGTNKMYYQWQFSNDGGKTWSGSTLNGANTSTLCLYDDDNVTHRMIGYSYRCVVSVNGNSAYDIKSATSNVIGPVVKGTAAAPSVSVGGTKKIESALKATVTGLPKYGNSNVSYQWQTSADGSTWADSTQSDAKSVSFKPAYSLVNQYVRCAVSVSNDQYNVATGYSAAFGKLGKASKTISAAITSPNKRNGDTLTCGISGLASNGSNTLTYKWECTNNSAFTSNVEVMIDKGNIHVTSVGTGTYYRCTVTASNPYYEYNTAVSPVYGPLAKGVASAPTVTVSGSNAWGSTLEATVTGLPKYGNNKVSYQWEARDDAGTSWGNSGYATATTDHITIDAQDAVSKARHYRCKVTVDNDQYAVPVAYSADHGKTVKASATAKASISGTAAVGGKLACSVSGLPTSGSNAVSYQWQYSNDNRTWANSTYADAKTSSHSLGYQDAYNLYWRCSVSVTNPYYSVPTAYTDSRLCGKGTASITASISGNAVIGGKLTCSVGGLPSIGTNSVKYRWQYSSDGKAWVDSSNATASSNSISLTPDETLGKYFRCVVSVTNPVYNDMSATSAASAKVGKGSHPAPSVSISGAKVYGSTLTAGVSGQPTGTTSTTYQWQRADAANGTYANIANATGRTYSVGTADMNKYLRVLVNTANTYYNVSQGVSAGYGAIGKATAAPSVKLGGTALTGGTLACTVSGLPAVGTNNIAYQWQYSKDGSTNWTNSSYSDAKTSSLKLQGSDLGWHYRCSVSFSGNAYYDIKGAVTTASAAIGKGTATAPKVTISGGKSYGSSMTASVSGQPSGTTSTSYRWQYSSDGGKTWANSTWSGSTTNKISSFGGDFEGKYFRCMVTTTSSQWNVPVAYSAAFGPLVKGSASISATLGGSAVVGGKLTASVGGLPSSGTNTVSYQWQSSKDGNSWTNSTTGNTKALSTGDLGLRYRCLVSATNPYYTIASGYTAASAAIGKGTVNASVSISGTKSVGSKLTANISGLPGTGTNTVAYKWQWSKDGSTGWTDSGYTDAKASSIVMHAEDVGYYYRCVITVSGNAYYNVNGATSAAYGPMGKGSHAAPTVSVSGTKAYGSTLTANVSGQPGGTTSTTYQWQRNSGTNGAWVNISNATGKTYVLTGSDINHSLRVLVNTSNTYYNVSQGVSAGYGAIGKAGKTISASVSGTKNNTSRLTVSVSGLPTVGTNTVSYQWQWSKDGSTGWTNSTYSDGKSNAIQMKEADVAYYYRCVVSVSGNAYYNVTGATTAAYGPMAKSSHGAPTVSVSGSKTYGSTLTANVSGQPTGTTGTSYQWQRADSASGSYSNISNATGKTYSVGTADMNKYLRVLVNTSNTYYNVSQGVSAGYGAIGKAGHAAPSVSVSGDKSVGATLTANVSGQPGGTTSTTYQWQRASSASGSYSNIANATGKTYKTVDADANKYVRVLVNTANTYYTVSQGVSAGYGTILVPKSFAIYSDGDKSLKFYRRASAPAVASTFNGQPVTALYENIESTSYTSVPWSSRMAQIAIVDIVDSGIKPTSIAGWFSGASALAKMDNISKLDVSATKDMSYAFSGCERLTKINLSSWNTASCTNMSYMFSSCKHLMQINVSSFRTSSVTDFSDMFYQCSNITDLDVSSFDTRNAKSISLMMAETLHMQRFKVGANFKIVNTNFVGMPSSINIPDCDSRWHSSTGGIYTSATIPSLKADTYYALANRTCVQQAYAVYSIDDNSLSFYKRSDVPDIGHIFNGKTATDVYPNLEAYDDTTLYHASPWSLKVASLRTAKVVDSGIQPRSTAWWFYFCTAMTTCDLSKLDTSKCVNMCWMFRSCSSLTTLDVSKFDTHLVTDLSSMFRDSSELGELDVRNWNVSRATNMGNMFNSCRRLTDLTGAENWNTSSNEHFDHMFANCVKLTLNASRWDTSAAKGASKHTGFNTMAHGVSEPQWHGLIGLNATSVENDSNPDMPSDDIAVDSDDIQDDKSACDRNGNSDTAADGAIHDDVDNSDSVDGVDSVDNVNSVDSDNASQQSSDDATSHEPLPEQLE